MIISPTCSWFIETPQKIYLFHPVRGSHHHCCRRREFSGGIPEPTKNGSDEDFAPSQWPIQRGTLFVDTVDGFRNSAITSWYGKYRPIICRVSYIPGGCLGFLPSTVALSQFGPLLCFFRPRCMFTRGIENQPGNTVAECGGGIGWLTCANSHGRKEKNPIQRCWGCWSKHIWKHRVQCTRCIMWEYVSCVALFDEKLKNHEICFWFHVPAIEAQGLESLSSHLLRKAIKPCWSFQKLENHFP